MGAYLSKPITEKFSSDEASEFIDVGASSMQGWRVSQEDAHNCMLDFDEKTSFFAVYDGHGGAEVATYCAQNLPEYLKNLEAYKSGDYEQALKDAFLGFDQTLLNEDIIEILKKLADEKNPDRDSELAEEEEEEDLAELRQEGSLPLDQVLEKYKTAKLHRTAGCSKNDDQKAVASGSGTPRTLSRFVRDRCNATEPGSQTEELQDTSDEQDDDEAVESDDICVSSSNVDKVKPMNTNTTASAVIDETCKISNSNNGGLKCTSPDSSLSSKNMSTNNSQEKLKNGDIKLHDECGVSESEKVSSTSSPPPVAGSSCSSKQENGIPSTLPTASSNQNVCGNSSSSGSSYKKAGRSIKDYSENSIVGRPVEDDESSSEEDDADFHAEENSSTEDGEEDCEPCDDEDTEEENEEEETEDEEGLIDDGFCANMIEEPGKDSGCTAVIALLQGKDLYVANAGDSRCVLCRGGEAIEMSLDHKPEDDREKNRIYKAGGKVTMDGRVNGGLNLSRAIGDHAYKMNKDLPADEQMISALPDIRKIVITSDDEFMILACDGIWNYMSSEEVVEFIKTRLDEGRESISKIIEELFDNCLAPHTIGDGTGCDNMTAVIVKFKQPKILELPTKLEEKSEIETAVVSSKKRLASVSVENDANNDTNTNSHKRLKTEEDSNKTPSSSSSSLMQSSKTESENVNPNPNNITSTTATVATVSTTTTSTPIATQKEQDSLVASTT